MMNSFSNCIYFKSLNKQVLHNFIYFMVFCFLMKILHEWFVRFYLHKGYFQIELVNLRQRHKKGLKRKQTLEVMCIVAIQLGKM